jgi:putative hemolysin
MRSSRGIEMSEKTDSITWLKGNRETFIEFGTCISEAMNELVMHIERTAAEIERLRAENARLNTVLSDVAYCDNPGENDEHCEREDGDLCPMYGWYDGPLCNITGMYIGDDPRNK